LSIIVFTIGHSNHSIKIFIEHLKRNRITAIGDVRSSPYSRFNPQFNREMLAESLKDVGIKYVFLGEGLGARSNDPACYKGGKMQYDLLANTNLFKLDLERVKTGARDYRIALMCAEKEPLDCHRTILVARNLVAHGVSVKHILADGSIEDHEETLERLLPIVGLNGDDLFRSRDDAIEEAYAKRAEAIAYSEADGQTGDNEFSKIRDLPEL
jgi:uncharacterized protein (DUF488 family)